MKRSCWILAASLAAPACVATSASLGQTILRVKSDAPSGGDGATWATAYNTLQAALELAGPGSEVWIAAGSYTGALTPYVSFDVPGLVSLFGGFRGDETNRLQRNPRVFSTVLSGDHARTVLRCQGVQGVLIDGFVLTNGLGAGNFASDLSNFDSYFGPGGGLLINNASVTISGCRIENNDATYAGVNPYPPSQPGSGAGAVVRNSTLYLVDCAFTDNRAATGVTMGCSGGYPFVASVSGSGGAIEAMASSLYIDRCEFIANSGGSGYAGTSCSHPINGGRGGVGGAVHAKNCTIAIDRCAFRANRSGQGGSGNQTGGWPPYPSDCGAPGEGGAIYLDGGSATITNTIFVNNAVPMSTVTPVCAGKGKPGGAIYVGGMLRVANCTFYGNTAFGTGGVGGALAGISPDIVNTILWNNADASGSLQSGQFGSSAPTLLAHSVVQGLGTGLGVGNLSVNPRFFDPLGPDGVLGTGDDRFDLRPDSPAIDAGDNSLYTFGPLDLAGHPRRIDVRGIPDTGVGPGAVIDMGAFEYVPCPADFDDGTGSGRPDGAVTIDDLLVFLGVYTSGSLRADLDNGSMTGTLDGAVTVDDLLYFLTKYEAGC